MSAPALVQVQCPDCGPVRLVATDIRVYPSAEMFRFQCPECGLVTHQFLSARVLGLLQDAGTYPQIVFDDLIDFHLSIDDELEELLP